MEDYSAPVPGIRNGGKINGCSEGASCAGNHPATPPRKGAQDTVLPPCVNMTREGAQGERRDEELLPTP